MNADALRVLSKRQLINLLCRRECRFDDADLAVLCAFLLSHLKRLQARAREAKGIEEASEFARWVVASGLAKLVDGSARVRSGNWLWTHSWTAIALGGMALGGRGLPGRSWRVSISGWMVCFRLWLRPGTRRTFQRWFARLLFSSFCLLHPRRLGAFMAVI